MKYFIESLGCAKNLVDSERFVALLMDYGFQESLEPEGADLVLVNTCAFLQKALGELDDVLGEIIDTIDERKTKVVVTGCVMNRALDDFLEIFPEVDAWIGLKDFAAFEDYLAAFVKKPPETKQYTGRRVQLDTENYVYLRISDGCDNHCSYCMIPSIRGEMKSESIEDLVSEAKALAESGATELVLIAQDSCLYGVDIYGEKALPRLIEALHEIEGFHWIRIMYMHPDHFEFEWTELWKRFPKLLPYFEIPIQHASNRIIKLMNRKKGYNQLKELFDHIKAEIPQAIFRTTIMLNYPGESEKDRNTLRKFLEEVDILHVGIFSYSPEKDCKGYNAPNYQFNWQKGENLMVAWAMEFAEIKEEKMQKFVGTNHAFLVDGYVPTMGAFVGRLWFQAPEIDGIAYTQFLPEDALLAEVEVVDAITHELWCHYNE